MNRISRSPGGSAAALAAAALVAAGCYSATNLTGDGSGDGVSDAGGTCPPSALLGMACPAGRDPCSTGPTCQICGAGSYVVRSATCFCVGGSDGAVWECDHVDCGPMAPGTYEDPECTVLRPYPDAGVDADADAGTACEGEQHWELEPWPIDEVQLLSSPSRYGSTDRLRLQVSAPSESCYRLGQVQVEVLPGDATDFVTVSVSLWHAVGDVGCTEEEFRAGWNVEVEGRQHGNFRVVVADGNSPGGGLRLEYEREIACSGVPECACYPGSPAGSGTEWSDCLTDCSCVAELSCLGYWGVGGPLWSCARGCNDFRDCGLSERCLPPVPDGAPWICEGGDQCGADWLPPCPPGFECQLDVGDAPNACVDRRTPPSSRECACDLDCGIGELCLLGMRATPTCELPCLRSEDCPEDWLVCGTAKICVPLGP